LPASEFISFLNILSQDEEMEDDERHLAKRQKTGDVEPDSPPILQTDEGRGSYSMCCLKKHEKINGIEYTYLCV
jgi:hypothetical protein